MAKKFKPPIIPPGGGARISPPAPNVSTSLIRMYVYDGTYYQTGLLDTTASSGKQCLSPDPQSFTSIEDMINYAAARGESIQQVTLDQVNSLCSGQIPYGGMQQGASCCLCQGGGARNFVPGAGNVPQDPAANVFPDQGPVLSILTPQETVAGRIIAKTQRQPINTIVY
jgi:hypothetical protein